MIRELLKLTSKADEKMTRLDAERLLKCVVKQ